MIKNYGLKWSARNDDDIIIRAGRFLMVDYMKRYDAGYEAGAALLKRAAGVSLTRIHDCPGSFSRALRRLISAPKHILI